MKNRVLIICTGNTCRSQMAEGFLKHFNPELEVFSAGTHAEDIINHYAVKVMNEIGIDISSQVPKDVSEFLNTTFDFVITVCDNANESCPYFFGNVKNRIHIGFEDPAKAQGTEEEKLNIYRKIRDQIQEEFHAFGIRYNLIPH